ncbi:MAG: FG-GAP repeat domain-containing protein [Ginsengibacter sp.]
MDRLLFHQFFIIIGTGCLLVFGCANSNTSSTNDVSNNNFVKKTLKTGKGPGSVEIADFNKDGFPDLVVANSSDSSLSIFLNDGKANFTEAMGSPFFANRYPNDIAITDFNNDGNMDLCVANTEAKFLSVFSGNGKGQFLQVKNSPFSVHTRPHTHGIAVADFNGDGYIDLATDDWGENKILIIFGDGKGNFGKETFFNVGNRPYQRLRSADVNKDGKPDIVTTNLEGKNATVLLGNGDGSFTEAKGSPFPCGAAPFGVAISDVNGDTNPDLAIVNSPTITAESKGLDGLWILTGDGQGNFSALNGSPFKTGKSPSRLAICDLDNDGINDIAVTNYNDKGITIFYMSKSGVHKSQTIQTGNRPDGIAAQDLNADGKKDIVVGNFDDNTITILLSK